MTRGERKKKLKTKCLERDLDLHRTEAHAVGLLDQRPDEGATAVDTPRGRTQTGKLRVGLSEDHKDLVCPVDRR